MPNFQNWQDIPGLQPRAGITQKGFRGDNVLITYNTITSDLTPGPHSHPFEQLFLILKGKIKLHLGDEVIDCVPGTVIRIPPDVMHWVEAPDPADGEVVNLDIFSHVRQDFLPLVAHQSLYQTRDTPL